MNLERELEISTHLANSAGDILLTFFHDRQYESSNKKGDRDLVTTADTASEEILVHGLAKAFPNDCVIAEEGGKVVANPTRTWYIDPLDGTINYAHGIPHWCISIALFDGEDPVLGVIHDPILGETFRAVVGAGTWCNQSRISCTPRIDLRSSCVHLTIDFDDEGQQVGLKDFELVAPHVMRTRSMGSVSLALAYTAMGRLDAVVHRYAHTWDYAAGVILIREAGGIVTDLVGEPYTPDTASVVAAANAHVHAELLALLHQPPL
ncbi:MAG TPA: inositol monophosphatase family protein [Chloroflexota bacterium]|nr:inositol monophosphatase family protein [Chloroflexota bacterium]